MKIAPYASAAIYTKIQLTLSYIYITSYALFT